VDLVIGTSTAVDLGIDKALHIGVQGQGILDSDSGQLLLCSQLSPSHCMRGQVRDVQAQLTTAAREQASNNRPQSPPSLRQYYAIYPSPASHYRLAISPRIASPQYQIRSSDCAVFRTLCSQ